MHLCIEVSIVRAHLPYIRSIQKLFGLACFQASSLPYVWRSHENSGVTKDPPLPFGNAAGIGWTRHVWRVVFMLEPK